VNRKSTAMGLLAALRPKLKGQSLAVLDAAIAMLGEGSSAERMRRKRAGPAVTSDAHGDVTVTRTSDAHGDVTVTRTSDANVTHNDGASDGFSSRASDPDLSESPSGPRNSVVLSTLSQLLPEGSKTVTSSSARARKSTAVAVDETHVEDRAAAWRAYVVGYTDRYGIAPVSNAKVRSQLKQFCARIPLEDVAATVAHYCRSQNARYVAARHGVGPMLVDAEALRMEALTGRQGTQAGARRADAVVDVQDQNRELLEMAREMDREKAARLANGGT
jgi:hypothetical protein